MLTAEQLSQYWSKVRNLTIIVLVVWALVSYGAAIIAGFLNKVTILGFPLGYYMGAQGSIITFIVLLIFYNKKMDATDEEFGVKEE